MAITTTQSRTVQAIVNLFETSQVRGDYGQVTLLAGDTGHLTFGRSQTTLGSGGLHTLVARYCANSGARFGPRLEKRLPAMLARDVALDADLVLHGAEVSETTLAALPSTCYDGPQPGARALVFQTSAPLCRGLDVRLVQVALGERGANVRADGVFGRASANCVADLQRAKGLPVTGVADAALVLELSNEATGRIGT